MKKQENNPGLQIQLSAADLFFCKASREGFGCDTGWYVDSGVAAMQEGVASEDDYPYDTWNQSCPIDGQDKFAMKVTSFEQIMSIEAAQKWLEEYGAIATSFAVYSDFMGYSSGVYRVTSNSLEGYHCVDIEGFNSEGWLCKNSWGGGWGDGGYFWIGYGEAGIDAEMFGIRSYELSSHYKRSLSFGRNRSRSRELVLPGEKASRPSCPGCRGRIL